MLRWLADGKEWGSAAVGRRWRRRSVPTLAQLPIPRCRDFLHIFLPVFIIVIIKELYLKRKEKKETEKCWKYFPHPKKLGRAPAINKNRTLHQV